MVTYGVSKGNERKYYSLSLFLFSVCCCLGAFAFILFVICGRVLLASLIDMVVRGFLLESSMLATDLGFGHWFLNLPFFVFCFRFLFALFLH